MAEEGVGILDAKHEGIDIDGGAADERDIPPRRFKREPARDVGEAKQVNRGVAAGGERRPLHVERDWSSRRRVAEQDGRERERRGRPVDRAAVSTEHSRGVDQHGGIGDGGCKSIDADKAAERGRCLGRHPEAVGIELRGDGEADRGPVEREAHAVGRLAVGAAPDAEKQVGQCGGEREHGCVDLAAVIERERGVVGPHPHADGLVDKVVDLQSGVALHVEEDLAADADVERGIRDARLDVAADREGGGEVGGVGGDQLLGRSVGEADVAADGEHAEQVDLESLDVEGHGARGDRLGKGVYGRADAELLVYGDRGGGRRVLNKHAIGAGDVQIRHGGREFGAGQFDRELVVLGPQAEPAGDGKTCHIAGSQRGRHALAHGCDLPVGEAEANVAGKRHEIFDRGGEAGDREGVCGRQDSLRERVVEAAGRHLAGRGERDPGRRELHQRRAACHVGQIGKLEPQRTAAEFESRS